MPLRPTILDRLSIVMVIGVFLTAQFGWLPLGIAAGQARLIPAWSVCGNELCTCAPTPVCPLCDGASICNKVDFSETERDDAIVTSTDTIVAVVTQPSRVRAMPVDEHQVAMREADAALRSRALSVPAPPPRA